MTIEEYSALIKEKFFYLFNSFGFQVVYTKEYRLGHYSIGLESSKCRILFARERSVGIMYLGTLMAPFGNEDSPQWFVMNKIVAYIVKGKPRWGSFENKNFQGKIIESISFDAKIFEPVCVNIMEMFRSSEVVAEWKPKFDEFFKKA